MIIWFARVELGRSDCSVDAVANPELLIKREGDMLYCGTDVASFGLTVPILKNTLRWIAQSGVGGDASLVWEFSSVAVPVAELAMLLRRWDETGEPPLLSIIAMVLGEDRHVTRGMKGFVGYELAARFSDPAQSRVAARNLARLARHGLVEGGLDRDAVYEGVDGRALCLDWSCRQGSPVMVTITLH